ncbi:MAG: Bor family protein [Gammaproteobacteria bacterium]|nr:Bor family protein [Gammaproteobacteria bacterium]
MLSILCLLQGCYGYRVQVKHPDPVTEPETEMVHSLFWGLMVSPQAVVANNCRSNALDEVYIQSNFGFSLLTVITLGIWSPMEIDWRCAEKSSNDSDDDGMI